LPALLTDGVTLVVSPLISLMHDQIEHMLAAGVIARTINANTSAAEANNILQEVLNNECKLLYVSPEKLVQSKTFQSRLDQLYSKRMLARVVIDEAVCVCCARSH
jgi:bloom syndrome protein